MAGCTPAQADPPFRPVEFELIGTTPNCLIYEGRTKPSAGLYSRVVVIEPRAGHSLNCGISVQ